MATSPSPSPAETYESFMVPYRFRPWANELADRLPLSPGMRVLDIACGTGIVARVIAERLGDGATIVGLDMNPAMIAVAEQAASSEGHSIRWEVGTADALPFPDGSFDLVTIQQALQFFPDQPAALRECARVLTPGGMLAISIWSSLDKQGLQRPYAEAIERVTGSPSMHAPYGKASQESLHALLSGAGFSHVVIEEVRIEVTFDDPDSFVQLMVDGTSAGVPAMHGRSDEERAALRDTVANEMAASVQAATIGGRLVSQSTTFIATAIRP